MYLPSCNVGYKLLRRVVRDQKLYLSVIVRLLITGPEFKTRLPGVPDYMRASIQQTSDREFERIALLRPLHNRSIAPHEFRMKPARLLSHRRGDWRCIVCKNAAPFWPSDSPYAVLLSIYPALSSPESRKCGSYLQVSLNTFHLLYVFVNTLCTFAPRANHQSTYQIVVLVA